MAETRMAIGGQGRLRDRLHELVLAEGLLAESPEDTTLLIGAFDRWDRDGVVAQQTSARGAGATYLNCHLRGSMGIVGPVVGPGMAGCAVCCEWRRLAVIGRRTNGEVDTAPVQQPSCWPAPMLDWLAGVALSWALEPASRPSRTAYVLELSDGSAHLHRFLPVGDCPACGGLPADGPTPCPPAAGQDARWNQVTLRSAGLPAAADLRRELEDWRLGVVTHRSRDDRMPLPTIVADLSVTEQVGRRAGVGRATTFEAAEAIAFLEALERLSGSWGRARRTTVRDSYRNLAAAIDPNLFSLPERVTAGGGQDPRDLVMSWVWGWSHTRDRPVLVPEQMAYFDPVPADPCIVRETSNGCGLGSTLVEASIHGLLEVAERDAFLLTWYGRLPAPRIDLGAVTDPLVATLVDRAEAIGYRVAAHDITSDIGVPVVWALLETEDRDLPASFTSAGAGTDPVGALAAALMEVVLYAYGEVRGRDALDCGRLEAMLRDGDLVRSMQDHTALYSLPMARQRFAFLRRARPTTVEGMRRRHRATWVGDTPEATLRNLTRRFAGVGVEVISVDQTSPELSEVGFHAVKMLAPGALPMTFGHRDRRVHGIPRLSEAPVRMGYWRRPRTLRQLAIHPHPFG